MVQDDTDIIINKKNKNDHYTTMTNKRRKYIQSAGNFVPIT